jgi:hypothetical protein
MGDSWKYYMPSPSTETEKKTANFWIFRDTASSIEPRKRSPQRQNVERVSALAHLRSIHQPTATNNYKKTHPHFLAGISRDFAHSLTDLKRPSTALPDNQIMEFRLSELLSDDKCQPHADIKFWRLSFDSDSSSRLCIRDIDSFRAAIFETGVQALFALSLSREKKLLFDGMGELQELIMGHSDPGLRRGSGIVVKEENFGEIAERFSEFRVRNLSSQRGILQRIQLRKMVGAMSLEQKLKVDWQKIDSMSSHDQIQLFLSTVKAIFSLSNIDVCIFHGPRNNLSLYSGTLPARVSTPSDPSQAYPPSPDLIIILEEYSHISLNLSTGIRSNSNCEQEGGGNKNIDERVEGDSAHLRINVVAQDNIDTGNTGGNTKAHRKITFDGFPVQKGTEVVPSSNGPRFEFSVEDRFKLRSDGEQTAYYRSSESTGRKESPKIREKKHDFYSQLNSKLNSPFLGKQENLMTREVDSPTQSPPQVSGSPSRKITKLDLKLDKFSNPVQSSSGGNLLSFVGQLSSRKPSTTFHPADHTFTASFQGSECPTIQASTPIHQRIQSIDCREGGKKVQRRVVMQVGQMIERMLVHDILIKSLLR